MKGHQPTIAQAFGVKVRKYFLWHRTCPVNWYKLIHTCFQDKQQVETIKSQNSTSGDPELSVTRRCQDELNPAINVCCPLPVQSLVSLLSSTSTVPLCSVQKQLGRRESTSFYFVNKPETRFKLWVGEMTIKLVTQSKVQSSTFESRWNQARISRISLIFYSLF